MNKFDEELLEVQEKIANLPEDEQVDYRTGLVNNMLNRLIESESINVGQISNGHQSFGDYEYNNIIMLSVIATLLSKYYPGRCYTMALDQNFFMLIIETPLGNYMKHLPNVLKEAFPVEEKDLNQEVLEKNEDYAIDILFSLFETEGEVG